MQSILVAIQVVSGCSIVHFAIFMLGRKRPKTDKPEFELVAETHNANVAPPAFEFVAATQSPDAALPLLEPTRYSGVSAPPDALSLLRPSEVSDSIYRLKRSTANAYTSVTCKLTRILQPPELLPEIERLCVVMTQVQLKGWHLANLHVLRCLKGKKELPEIEQMFLYRCYTATLGNTETRDRDATQPTYPSSHETFSRYWARRGCVQTSASEHVVNDSSMVNEMAELMKTNALNMIALVDLRSL